jgi:DNA-binding XRE family transcriptional regulator
MKKQDSKKKPVKAVPKKKTENSGQEVLQEFYVNLKKAVADTGLSSYAWAKKLGMDKQSISSIVRGNSDPKLSTAVRIARGARISLDSLVGISCSSSRGDSYERPPLEAAANEKNAEFISRVMKMREPDIDLLEGIAVLLEKCREKAMSKLIQAIKDKPVSGKPVAEGVKATPSLKDDIGGLEEDYSDDDDGLEDDDWDFEDDDFRFSDDDFGEDDDFDDDDDE